MLRFLKQILVLVVQLIKTKSQKSHDKWWISNFDPRIL